MCETKIYPQEVHLQLKDTFKGYPLKALTTVLQPCVSDWNLRCHMGKRRKIEQGRREGTKDIAAKGRQGLGI